jgi:hypothetical protein
MSHKVQIAYEIGDIVYWKDTFIGGVLKVNPNFNCGKISKVIISYQLSSVSVSYEVDGYAVGDGVLPYALGRSIPAEEEELLTQKDANTLLKYMFSEEYYKVIWERVKEPLSFKSDPEETENGLDRGFREWFNCKFSD